MDDAERQRMILSLWPRVISVVNRIFVALPSGIEREDLISEGMIGAIAAVDSFESARGLKLNTFAEFKIRGRILDYLRRADPLKRAHRKKIKNGEEAAPAVTTLQSDIPDGGSQVALTRIEARADLRGCLHRAQLTRRQRFVLGRRYWDFALDREIAAELGVHQSAVSQTHSRAIAKLRS